MNLAGSEVAQSQEDMRMKATSPLDVAEPSDTAMQTQDMKMTFKGNEAVIHEVDEEQHPEDPSENNQRHSILKVEKENHVDQSSLESKSKAGKAAHSIVQKSSSQNEEDNPIEMNETSQVEVSNRALLQEMGSTGEVAVEKSLGLNTQEEALEFAATTQAAD